MSIPAALLPTGKGEETLLRWPLPAEVLATNPELAQAAIADAARARVREGDPAQMLSDTAGEPMEYRESSGGTVIVIYLELCFHACRLH